MLIRLFIIALCITNSSLAISQLPKSNIYHFNWTKFGDKYAIKSPKFLTQFNKEGYNNQPYFFDDRLIYFTTNYYGNNQTDIASMDLFEKTLRRITYTKESEYSPIPVPESENFSCVRVELDDKTQSLSVYPNDGLSFAKRLMNNSSNIGYYNWMNQDTLALFLIDDDSNSLALADAVSERRKIIVDNIGRTLKVDSQGQLYFIHKISDSEWMIKAYNEKENKIRTLTKTLQGVEDFELLVDGSIISGKGSKLFICPNNQSEWKELFDMKKYGITNISRLVIYKNNLLVVNN